jgi:hypothetical protein
MIAAERHSFRIVLAPLVAVLLCAPVSLHAALVNYDFESPFFSEAPEPVLDHCVVLQDGIYHLFYLRGNPAVNIGHATTTDFTHWNLLPPVLSLGAWDDKALWAPYLIPLDENDNWLMYYTGVNVPNAQQSGLALSNGLSDWWKWPTPVYHPDQSWAEWTDSGFSHGRDPHVIKYDNRYYMFVTAKTKENRGAVACGVSDNLVTWQDIGPIYVHDSWHVFESTFILQRPDGKWHMFFTEEAVYGTSHMYSDSLFTGWNIANRRIIDPGHAPQITETPNGPMFSRHSVYNDNHGTTRHVLRFSPMQWLNQYAVVPKQSPLIGQWSFVSGDVFFYQPTFQNNAYVRDENYASTFVGDGWINTYEFYTGPMGYGTPGQFSGDVKTGVIRSTPFTIQGNSMNLLVGGGNYPNECYVALVEQSSGEVLYKETGKNSNEMDRRFWDLRPYAGTTAYIEIADISTAAFGHVCVDDIIESTDVVLPGGGGTGKTPRKPEVEILAAARGARLFANTPNPFNPSTTIGYQIGDDASVRVDVFDARGAHVRTLVDEHQRAGTHSVGWDGTGQRGESLASGVYFYRLTVSGRVIETRKMALLK